MLRTLDAFAFSSALVACAAAALVAAASHALGFAAQPAVLALAFCGTVVVYCVDRLRDLARDAHTSPRRTAFVAANQHALRAFAALAMGGALGAGVLVSVRATAVAGAVAAFGLAHRRLKHWPWGKPFYVSGSWTAVAVGLPAAEASARAPIDRTRVAAVALLIGACVHANVILSNLRDAEGLAARIGRRRACAVAAVLCIAAGAFALAVGPELRPLVALPLAMGAAVAAFRPGERYGALAADGALLAGALVALALGSASR